MTTFKDLLISYVGPYTPDLTANDWGQIDWVWIASAILLIVLVVTFFKAIRFVLGGFRK